MNEEERAGEGGREKEAEKRVVRKGGRERGSESRWLLASFHGDSNGLSTQPVVSCLHDAAQTLFRQTTLLPPSLSLLPTLHVRTHLSSLWWWCCCERTDRRSTLTGLRQNPKERTLKIEP